MSNNNGRYGDEGPVQGELPDFDNFATAEYPLRVSSWPKLLACAWSALLQHMDHERLKEDKAGKAADTGSHADFVIDLWHRGIAERDAQGNETGRRMLDVGQCVDAARAQREREGVWPRSDTERAEAAAQHYAADPRNARELVVVDSLQREVVVALPCSDDDPTGRPIFVSGHCDQVRRNPATRSLEVWDVKCSSLDPARQLMPSYAPQLAGYALAFTYAGTFGEPVYPGGFIVPTRYNAWVVKQHEKGEPALLEQAPTHFPVSWDMTACEMLLETVQTIIARIRDGEVTITPGSGCLFCRAGDFARCTTIMADLQRDLLHEQAQQILADGPLAE